MKRVIFLSFRPEFFRPILYGIKKYEYRKRFCNEATTAYLYLSSPIREVIGIVEFGKPLIIDELILRYSDNLKINNRLLRCKNNLEKYAIPIESLQLFKNPIPIALLKNMFPSFSVPYSYLNLKNNMEVLNYLQSQPFDDVLFKHSHESVCEENIGVYCSEMESTIEYQEKDKYFRSNANFDKIKC